jgi:hypothetical protein
LPSNQQKGGKKERWPPLTVGQPNHDRFEAFLWSRKTEANETLRDLFSKRESGKGRWEKYTFRNWNEAALPTESQGHNAWRGQPAYETFYHGIKMEALFSILAGIETQAGGLQASGDRQKGQRFNEERGVDKKGVYFHAEKDMKKALSYAHWVPLFADGCYVQAMFECRVDRAHRIVYDHHDQKLQKPNIDCERAQRWEEPYLGGPLYLPHVLAREDSGISGLAGRRYVLDDVEPWRGSQARIHQSTLWDQSGRASLHGRISTRD